jgi:hypothetical protein
MIDHGGEHERLTAEQRARVLIDEQLVAAGHGRAGYTPPPTAPPITDSSPPLIGGSRLSRQGLEVLVQAGLTGL